MTIWQTALFFVAWFVVVIHVVVLVFLWHALITLSYQQYIEKRHQSHQ
jgi:hypothetical protein